MSLYISNIYDCLINVYACDCMCIDQYALWTSGCNWFCLSWYPSCPQITFVTPWVVQRIVDNRLPSKWPNQMDICEHSWIFLIRNSKHYGYLWLIWLSSAPGRIDLHKLLENGSAGLRSGREPKTPAFRCWHAGSLDVECRLNMLNVGWM